MKVKILLGYYHMPNIGEPMLGHIYLNPVSFPMHMDSGIANNEQEMLEIAERDFDEFEVYNMPVPLGAVVDPETAQELEDFADQLEDDAHELEKFPGEKEVVRNKYLRASKLRKQASLLRGEL